MLLPWMTTNLRENHSLPFLVLIPINICSRSSVIQVVLSRIQTKILYRYYLFSNLLWMKYRKKEKQQQKKRKKKEKKEISNNWQCMNSWS